MLKIRGIPNLTVLKSLLKSEPSTPVKKAMSLTFGFYLSLFPVLGFTTLLCVLFSFVFKLKHYLVQGLNVILIPLQLILMIPLLKSGRLLFYNNEKIIPEISVKDFYRLNNWETLNLLFESVAGGIVLWFVLSALTAPLFYFIWLRFIKNLNTKTVMKNKAF